MIDIEYKPVRVQLPDGSEITGMFGIVETDYDPQVELILSFKDRKLSAKSDDFFYAMQSIRLELEPEGIRLLCCGASLNVHPSGMILDMGSARVAYKMAPGRSAKQEDLVSIFDTGTDVIPATIEEQERYYDEWYRDRSKRS